MSDTPIPPDVRALADARALARAGRDWVEADRLRADIEAAGWKVVDRGFSYALEPAYPPDILDAWGVRHGRVESVPSRLAEPLSGLASIVLIAAAPDGDLERALRSLSRHAPDRTSVVVVADGPSADESAALERLVDGATEGRRRPSVEIVRTSASLGWAAALAIGIRRAAAPVVIALGTSVEATGDLVTPLVAALVDPSVAIAGGRGVKSSDLRRFQEAGPGDVDAIELDCQAFRRDDAAARGPLDERFRSQAHLATWWSLALRDEGEGVTPRRALVVADLPIVHHASRLERDGVPERTRSEKRDFYRLMDRYGGRTDLLSGHEAPHGRREPDRA